MDLINKSISLGSKMGKKEKTSLCFGYKDQTLPSFSSRVEERSGMGQNVSNI